jgi:hypothetical protein
MDRLARFHREPTAGNVLQYSDVKARHIEDVDDVRVFVDVWNRRVANLQCPFSSVSVIEQHAFTPFPHN